MVVNLNVDVHVTFYKLELLDVIQNLDKFVFDFQLGMTSWSVHQQKSGHDS